MSLPTETLFIIAELVRNEDIAAYKTLSLVSPLFRDICQQRLFESVRLQNNVMDEYNKTIPPAFLVRFHSMVTQNSRIASYVRKLEIAQYSIPSTGGIRDKDPEIPMLWMIDQPGLLTEVLDALEPSLIHTLTLASRRRIDWTRLDEGVRKSILHIAQAPSLQNITLDGVNVPGYFFSDFSGRLQSVELNSPRFPPETFDMPPSTHTHSISRLTFRVLRDHGIYAMPNTLCVGPIIGLDFSQLASLDVDVCLGQIPHLKHFFQLTNLRDLRLAISLQGFFPTNPIPRLDLSGLSKLTRLTMCETNFDNSVQTFHRLGNGLATLTPAQCRRLEVVTIELLTMDASLQRNPNFNTTAPLSGTLSFLHENSMVLDRILVHLKASSGWDDTHRNSYVRAAILQKLRWSGCESVLVVKVESTTDWFNRNRTIVW